METNKRRRLITLMFTDMVGYSALSQKDEQLAFALLEEHRRIIREAFSKFGGVENKTIGDAFFIEFTSVVEAVRCAVEIQNFFYERNASASMKQKILIRIGLHLADVIDSEKDSYGDGVNIASRLEGACEPGGILVSGPVYEQVKTQLNFDFKPVNNKKLKNISKPIAIFKLILPWEQDHKKPKPTPLTFARNQNHYQNFLKTVGSAGALLLTVLLILGFVLWKASIGVHTSKWKSPALLEGRLTSFKAPDHRIDLLTGTWHYATSQELSGPLWREFDHMNPWRYSDEFKGYVRLQYRFRDHSEFMQPSMVLGRVSGKHRVYLNGKFIGGSNYLSNIALYPFDQSLLSNTQENVIDVLLLTPPSLNPGLLPLHQIGAFIAEFDQVYGYVLDDNVLFHTMNQVYLVVSFMLFIICLSIYLLRRSNREYLYFAIFLLFGTLGISYYNTVFASVLNFQVLHFIRLFGITGSSIVLLSTYHFLTKRSRGESLSNLAILAFTGVICFVLLGQELSSNEYLRRHNIILLVMSLFNIIWITWATIEWVGEFRAGTRTTPATDQEIAVWHKLLVIIFGTIAASITFYSIRGTFELFAISPILTTALKNLGILYPFFFSIFLLAMGAIDYSRKIKWIEYRKKRADLMLDILPSIERNKDLADVTKIIHQRVSDFVNAQRSSIYLANNEGNSLRLFHGIANQKSKSHLKESISTVEGVIGHVWQNKTPMMTKNINFDPRFNPERLMSEKVISYKSGVCMIFPLIARNHVVGVLTLADKKGGAPFSSEEFAFVRVMAKDMALLLLISMQEEKISELESKVTKSA